ncbi:ATP-binding protein [Sphingomonas sp.]|uniref:ATP-binding protein n=1 Tax=Sphingomonas sp. TaxID=28214 RepID=UPI003B3B6561
MSGAAVGIKRAAGRPLFVRIFLLLLGTLVSMQAMNVVLVIVTPPPAPRLFTLDQIESALRGGGHETIMRRELSDPGIAQGDSLHERHIRDLLASRLAVDPTALRVGLRPAGPRMGPFARRGLFRDFPDFNGVAGDFMIALRHADGTWVVVSPAGLALGFWRWRAVVTLLAALLIAAPIAWWLSRRIARPIAMFAGAADRLGRDPRGSPIDLSGPPEVAEAAAAFNGMQQRLQRYVADRALMLGAVAHDLRTPLMRIGLHVENAPAGIRAAIESEIVDMQAMLSAVLAFLRDEEQPARRQRLDLRTIAQSVVDELGDEGHRIELEEGGPLVIEGDPGGLKTLVTNLVRNAVTHAGGAIYVALGAEPSIAWLEVRDDGPGLDEGMLERVFEPFVRGEESRSRETGGIGLGLASARAVARRHGGDVTLINHADGGLVARIELSR